MHLEGPALTTTGKKKGKKKFASSEAKRKSESLAKDWEEMMKKWEPKPVAKKKFKMESVAPAMSTPRLQETKPLPSLVTPGGDCSKKDPTMYTGTKIIGLATMHKSSIVPIFSKEEAVEVSTMRR